ncbi:TPA: hypothetical protein PXM37_004357 [Yersinia enterocolitica]|nr:hypothetical protein [Yersinia enterocolitica]HDL6985373.1 hypothetical protein [Yersinia enterocolitica]HDL7067914.1 hypothetical protein [Yersinia enterocolitica]HDL7072306.1 hypothetical protein [Yersinia enterocolitica]
MTKIGTKTIKKFACIIMVGLLCGCSNLGTTLTSSNDNNSEQLAIKQTKKFFNEHPEYLSSKELESKLFVEFKLIMKQSGNEDLNMYQMLIIAHDRLQRK